MNKNLFYLIVAVIVVLAAGSLWAKNRNTTSPSAESSPTPSATLDTSASTATPLSTVQSSATQYTVVHTDQGFTPATLQVVVGSTVQFRNDSANAVWVASDPHPTHTDYPGFDAKKGYAQGETYSFTFNQKGTWGYHNHFDPAQKGTIVVE